VRGPGGNEGDIGGELVDVVDADDHVIATVTRRQMRAERLLHRSVGVAVMSDDGRLLVHRRSTAKDVWPGRWDVAVGGVVVAGETYEQAAVRELGEEVGIGGVVPRPIGGGTFVDDDVATIARCYVVIHDGPFSFDDGEVVEVRWVDRAALVALRAEATFVPDSLAILLPLLDLS
jgi:isopentenyldiphosphate isomerase